MTRSAPFPTRLLLLFLCLLPLAPAPGEELPPGPIIARMPERSAWTVIYHYPTPEEGRPPSRFARYRPTQQRVTRDGTLVHAITVFGSGAEEERWIAGSLEAMRVQGSQEVVAVEFGEVPPPDYFRFETSDFQGLDWVTPENYRGTRSYEGRRVRVFFMSSRGGETASGNAEIPPFPLELGKGGIRLALIDAETRRPLYYADGWHARTYRYAAAAGPGLLRPPEPFLKVLRKLGYTE